MAISLNDIVFRSAAVNDDTSLNGGRMTSAVVTTGVKNNLWPNVPQSERSSGSSKFRKLFIHVANSSNLTLIAAKVFLVAPTPAEDRMLICLGNQSDTQNGALVTSAVADNTFFGAGKLDSNANAGETTITVSVENAADNIFRDGETIRISNQSYSGSTTGTVEYFVVSGDPTYVANLATITLAAPLAYNYLASDTNVSSVMLVGDVKVGITVPVKSGSGTFTVPSTNLPTADAIGSIDQTWTLSFTNSTSFTLVGNSLVGTVATGTISADFTPMNSSLSKPYFNLPRLFWGSGAGLQSGTVITLTTTPASIPVWFNRIVPAGAQSLSGNKAVLGIDGESE